ncbi:hypothetical protein [Pseudooceanicola spongiae]|uniref:hypothetical protein n=1 Tax=Pseudooceanicola spongiae TaxID=2613965 RepID=UPI001D017610|nr:hypothetical protein [Pseudooceanicola spongiae]
MSPRPGPVFLERRGYRQRRMLDAARVLPMLGLVLLGVPLLWPNGGAEAMPTSHAMIYIFGVWALLALASAVLVSRLSDLAADDPETPKPTGPVSGAEIAPATGPEIGPR